MGRCGIVQFSQHESEVALIECLAISCRTRARGLSLAMLVGMLRHPRVGYRQFRCRYIFNGLNRPLRMLLMAAGFKPEEKSDELKLTSDRLAKLQLPDWVQIDHTL